MTRAGFGDSEHGATPTFYAAPSLPRTAPVGTAKRPLPLIIDSDPGIDDALAIGLAVASPELFLLAVTTVGGNADVRHCTDNALRLLHAFGRSDIPVAEGADGPLTGSLVRATEIHGEGGIGRTELPPSPAAVHGEGAVELMARLLRESPVPVAIAPIGPLTNIAIALRLAPDIATKVAGISVMGGGRFGNITTAAEFNIWADPEAAEMVFDYGGPLIMAGLDLTHQFQAIPSRIERVRSIGSRLSTALADLLDFFSGTYVGRHDNMDGAAVHDPCAVLALTHPQLFTSRPRRVVVETAGVHTRGMTLIDDRGLLERREPNTTLLETIDVEAGFDVLIESIRTLSTVS